MQQTEFDRWLWLWKRGLIPDPQICALVFYGSDFDGLFYKKVRQLAAPLFSKGVVEIKPDESFGNPQWVGPIEVMEELEGIVRAELSQFKKKEADYYWDDNGIGSVIDSRFWLIRGSSTALNHWARKFKD